MGSYHAMLYPTRVSMEVIVASDRKLGYFTYVSGTYPSPTFMGVIIIPRIPASKFNSVFPQCRS